MLSNMWIPSLLFCSECGFQICSLSSFLAATAQVSHFIGAMPQPSFDTEFAPQGTNENKYDSRDHSYFDIPCTDHKQQHISCHYCKTSSNVDLKTLFGGQQL